MCECKYSRLSLSVFAYSRIWISLCRRSIKRCLSLFYNSQNSFLSQAVCAKQGLTHPMVYFNFLSFNYFDLSISLEPKEDDFSHLKPFFITYTDFKSSKILTVTIKNAGFSHTPQPKLSENLGKRKRKKLNEFSEPILSRKIVHDWKPALLSTYHMGSVSKLDLPTSSLLPSAVSPWFTTTLHLPEVFYSPSRNLGLSGRILRVGSEFVFTPTTHHSQLFTEFPTMLRHYVKYQGYSKT